MASKVTVADRVGNALKEVLVPDVQENYWRMNNYPMLRVLGMEAKEEQPNKGSGSSTPRAPSVVDKLDINDNFEVFHLHTAFGGGVHAAAEDTALRGGKFKGSRTLATTRYIQGKFTLTGQSMAVTRDKKLSVTKEVTGNAMGAVRSIHWNMNRMIVGPGNGILAYVNVAVSGATTVNVDNNGTEETPPTQHLNSGDELWIGTSAEITTVTGYSAVTVDSVTDDNTFEAEDNETLADDDIIVRADVHNGTSYQEINGFANLINNTGTTQNVDKAANRWFQSQLTAVSGNITINKMDGVVMKARRFAVDPSALFWLMNSTQWQRYNSLLTATKSIYTVNTESFEGNLVGGVKGVVFYSPDGKIPCLIDDMVPDGVMWLVDPNAFMYGKVRDFGFADDALSQEGVPGQRIAGTLNYEFAFWMGGEFAQTNAPACAKLSAITGPSVA
jgi:hypothetical protein